MMKWLSIFCSKCQMFIDMGTEEIIGKNSVSRVVILLFICSSLTFSVIISLLLPNLISIWANLQSGKSWKLSLPTTSFSFSGHSHNAETVQHTSVATNLQRDFKFDLCSKEFQMLDERIQDVGATNDVMKQRKIKNKNSELVGEAMSSIHLAQDMVAHGKLEKAAKLFQHAVALAPKHPDVLTEYGEFFEKYQSDYVNAEHMYCKALINRPDHGKALVNRARTLPLVEEIDQAYYNRIDTKRKLLLGIPENHPGVKRMMVESYFKHIYHTTAIEGNTFTLSQTRMLVENRLAIGGKSLVEHNEILGMDSAFTYVNNTLLDRMGKLTLQDIKNIHKRVLGFVDPVGAGEFRTTQVVVGDFTPPESKLVQRYMEEFIDWLNMEDTLSLHPIELAALAHYKFVWIHPFYDGNGRTSRLLMNMILMQAGYPPIIIQKEEKHVYYEHLQTGNDGDIRPFIRFIGLCTERAIDEYLMAGLEDAPSLLSQLYNAKPVDDGRTIIVDQEHDDYVRTIILDDDS